MGIGAEAGGESRGSPSGVPRSFLPLSVTQDLPEDLLKHKFLGSTARVSGQAGRI